MDKEIEIPLPFFALYIVLLIVILIVIVFLFDSPNVPYVVGALVLIAIYIIRSGHIFNPHNTKEHIETKNTEERKINVEIKR